MLALCQVKRECRGGGQHTSEHSDGVGADMARERRARNMRRTDGNGESIILILGGCGWVCWVLVKC